MIYAVSLSQHMIIDYTRDKKSGERFLSLYNITTANVASFPMGFSGTNIMYRGYEIHILPFGNYNMFFVINEDEKQITMLRVLYQKQDWKTILKIDNTYHYQGKEK